LCARGHAVTFAGYASQQARIAEQRFPFRLLARSQAAWEERLAGHPWTLLLEGALACPAHLDEVPEAVAEEQPDALVVDCMLWAALTATERARLPAAVLVHSAPGALLPPGGFLERELLSPLNALREQSALAPAVRVLDAWTAFPALCATIPALDPLASAAPTTFDYVGPIFDRAPHAGWLAPWPSGDRRPLVLVSFSTYMDQRSRIQRTLEGLAEQPYRVLVTVGNTDAAGLTVPGNAVLVRQVPHEAVLPGAGCVVTHAGHGTVTASLAHGVPLVCLPNPLVADQVPLAMQVQALGAGRMLDGEAASSTEIATAVREVTMTAAFRAAARDLAATIAARPSARLAADRLERLLGQEQPLQTA
jgi:UDP:flavonoid glycosyltransferase YjiC (YdhE family)